MADIVFVNETEKLELRQETNGTLLLATKLLQAGIDTQVLRFGQMEHYNRDYAAFIREITGKILAKSPKCVAFYTLWPYYHIVLRIARCLKEADSDIAIILGGPQASATAQATMEAMEFVDYICTGEGEDTIVPFVQALLRKDTGALARIPGLYYRSQGAVCHCEEQIPLCDLNSLPHWDDRLLCRQAEGDIDSPYYFMPIDAGRGCPYNCTFCCTSHFWRRTYRLKSAQRIVDDIRYYYDKFGIRSFWFSHDAFTTNRQLVSDVCDRILEAGLQITWRCTTRIDCISEELILKMQRSGMTSIELGIETGSAKMQKLTNKRLNLEKSQQMIRFLLKQNIRVGLFFMYGFPEENEQDLNETLELLFSLVDLGIHNASMSYCRFNPATAITEQYYDQLEFDPQRNILFRRIFGFREEQDIIAANKAMFPFFFHLHTKVRDEYQYLYCFAHLYQQFPQSIKFLRQLYGGDNLRFYRDYCRANPGLFDDLNLAVEKIDNHPMELFDNMLRLVDSPKLPQLRSLLQFCFDSHQVFYGKEDTVVQKIYDFRYVDYKLRLPLEQYGVGKTEILLKREKGKKELKIIRFIT